MIAFLKKSGPSSGESEKSISESWSASNFFQSVLDRFFVLFVFTLGSLLERDDANGVRFAFRENHVCDATVNQAQPNPTLFSVIFPRVRFYD